MNTAQGRLFRFGVVAGQARSGEEWVAKARRAEELGFATFLIPDTLGRTLAPLPALTAAACATTTIHLGTYVLANDIRNPVLLAREAATLDLLSGGRFELGLGAGRPGIEADYRKLGIEPSSGGERVARLAESLAILKGLFRGEQVQALGPYYQPADADLFPLPTRIPILVAGSGRRLLELAAREADMVALGLGPTASEAEAAEKMGLLRTAAGERFEQIEINMNLLIVGDKPPPWMPPGLEPDMLIRTGALSVLRGSTADMCEELLRRRERLGISYVVTSDVMMEQLAPVVAELAGR